MTAYYIQKVICNSRVSNKIYLIRRSMSSSSLGSLIGVCQLNCTNDKIKNFDICKTLIMDASNKGAKMVFFPEAFDYIGESKEEAVRLAESLDGPTITQYKDLAKSNNVWLSLGGFHERITDDKIANTSLIISSNGEIVSTYQKTHLFDVDLPSKNLKLTESSYVQRGSKIGPPVKTPVGNIGQCICYDMRFPEISLMLKSMGANILAFPSAFTFATGAVHWEVLLRARAIENQVYVIAAAQTGIHNKKRTSWGHSMVIDPYGNVIAQCSDGVGVSLANIDVSKVEQLGQEMPVWSHKRYDLYPQMTCGPLPAPEERYQFGQVSVSSEAVFYRTPLTIAFTNKRCVVPGHVLVAPVRVVPRMKDLGPTEISDLFQAVQLVEGVIEKIFGSSSSTVVVQDGPLAGQTIKHVHVHILPRKEGDFKRNDDIYYELEKHDKVETAPIRTEEEMAEEAVRFKKFFDTI